MNQPAMQVSPEQKRKSKRALFIMLAVAVVPIVAAYTAFYSGIGVPDNTVNKGALIKAISLEPLVGDEMWKYFSEERKWRLIIPVGSECNAQCEQNLYSTRQVHIRLNDKGVRVERYALNIDGDLGAQYLDGLAETHPNLKRLNVERGLWDSWSAELDKFKKEGAHFYMLADQEGYAMMVYTDQHGNELLKDIKRALRYSIDHQ